MTNLQIQYNVVISDDCLVQLVAMIESSLSSWWVLWVLCLWRSLDIERLLPRNNPYRDGMDPVWVGQLEHRLSNFQLSLQDEDQTQRIYDGVQCLSNWLLPNEYRIQNSDDSVESTWKIQNKDHLWSDLIVVILFLWDLSSIWEIF